MGGHQPGHQSLEGFCRAPSSALHSSIFFFMSFGHDTDLKSILSKFDDATELGGAVDSLEDMEALLRDINKLGTWRIANHVKLSKGNCQNLHVQQAGATLDVCID